MMGSRLPKITRGLRATRALRRPAILASLVLACCPSAHATTLTRETKLTASDAAAGDFFGDSVAISGDTAVAGSRNHSDGGSQTGSAYVFVRSGGVWSQQQELTAGDPSPENAFGSSVAISGDTAVVGSPVRSRTDSGGTGAAYVFVRSGGVWSQQQKLTASDAARGDQFGWSLSASGDTALVGAIGDDAAGLAAGKAYVFVRSGATWSQQQKLTPIGAAAFDFFGLSASVAGDAAVVGSLADGEAGAAYVFARSAGVWSQQQKLVASDIAVLDAFGASVAVGSDTVLVGSPGHSPANGFEGAAYVYEPPSSFAKLWIGLRNSDDVGTHFDLKAESFLNGAAIGSGEIDDVPGGSSGFGQALLRTIALSTPPVSAGSGDTLSIRLSVRIGATGHRSGTARLWYGDAQANSRFSATVNGLTADYYLRNGFVLGTSAGPGPQKTIDVFADRLVGGNPFKPFGTWSVTLP